VKVPVTVPLPVSSANVPGSDEIEQNEWGVGVGELPHVTLLVLPTAVIVT
jgi:hypothetical protein